MSDQAAQQEPDNSSQHSFEALLNATVDAIIVIDHTGVIEIFNRAAEHIFGYHSTEVIGKKINCLMPEPYQSEHDSYIDNYLTTQQAKIIGIGREVQAMRKNGTVFPIDLAVGRISGGIVPRFVGIIRDISERRRIENQLKRQNEELHQQRERLAHVARMGTMGEMATGLAHEINQPLTAISTYAQACRILLQNQQLDPQDLSQTLDKISAQAERAGEVIRRLRAFLKKSKATRERSNINKLVQEVVKMAEIDSRLAGIPIQMQLDYSIGDVKADTVQIQQVVLNLVRNGIDAMTPGHSMNRINIRTRPIERGDAVEVAISDHGPGLSRETGKHIFEPFYTTKTSGMGMGLAICRSIIQEHGGKMWFENNHTSPGATFFFTLPTSMD